MTPDRYNQLIHDLSTVLTVEEMREGWHFCPNWDGLLIQMGRDEPCPCDPWTEEEIEKSYAS